MNGFTAYARWCRQQKKNEGYATVSVKSAAGFDDTLIQLAQIAEQAGDADVFDRVWVGYRGSILTLDKFNIGTDGNKALATYRTLLSDSNHGNLRRALSCYRVSFCAAEKDPVTAIRDNLFIRGQDVGKVQIYLSLPEELGRNNQEDLSRQILSGQSLSAIGKPQYHPGTQVPYIEIPVLNPRQITPVQALPRIAPVAASRPEAEV